MNCRDHPDIQAMLNEAVQGKEGRPAKPKEETLYNVQALQAATGNSRAAGLRKLRKYAFNSSLQLDQKHCFRSKKLLFQRDFLK